MFIWKVEDVDYFCQGLTDDQKLDWVQSANTFFENIHSHGFSEEQCKERSAKRATSTFTNTLSDESVPAMALVFSESEPKVTFLKNEQDEDIAQLNMVGYSGGVIKDHWWWDDLAIDLSGVSFESDKFPILENHDTDRKVAFTGKPIVDENGIVADPDTTVFLESEVATEFIANSKKGFPYQSSVYVNPTSIERIDKDAEVEVNGFILKGPGTVFRKCEFKEMSVCVFGWDSNTNATAFNKEVNIPGVSRIGKFFSEQVSDDAESSRNDNNRLNMEGNEMDEETLKKEHPELYKALFEKGIAQGVTQGKADAETIFNEQKDEMTVKLTQMNDKISLFEKAEIIRSEKELKMEADAVFSSKLAKSDVPEHLHSKVKKHVSYSKFVTDDKFDKEAFSAAIDEEIKSWVDAGISNSVMGSSFSTDGEEGKTTKLAEQIDESVERLLSVVQR